MIFLGIVLLGFLQSGQALTEANGPTNEDMACFDDEIATFIDSNNIPGANIALLEKGNLVYEQGYGTRDVLGVSSKAATDLRLSLPSTPFRIGGISKSITSLTILRMAQAGMLDLDDVVFGAGGALENTAKAVNITDSRKLDITVRDFLQQSSGYDDSVTGDPLSRPFTDMLSKKLGRTATCSDTITMMLQFNLQMDPGTSFSPSNLCYCVLGSIIESLADMSYGEAVSKFLLEPAGIDSSEMYLGKTRIEDIPSEEAQYETMLDVGGISLFSVNNTVASAAYGSVVSLEMVEASGGWVASARMILKLLASVFPAHCQDVCLLEDSYLNELQSVPSYVDNDLIWYGLGFYVFKNNGNLTMFNADQSLVPGATAILMDKGESTGLAYAVLLNSDDDSAASEINNGLIQRLLDNCTNPWPMNVSYALTAPTVEIEGETEKPITPSNESIVTEKPETPPDTETPATPLDESSGTVVFSLAARMLSFFLCVSILLN